MILQKNEYGENVCSTETMLLDLNLGNDSLPNQQQHSDPSTVYVQIKMRNLKIQ